MRALLLTAFSATALAAQTGNFIGQPRLKPLLPSFKTGVPAPAGGPVQLRFRAPAAPRVCAVPLVGALAPADIDSGIFLRGQETAAGSTMPQVLPPAPSCADGLPGRAR